MEKSDRTQEPSSGAGATLGDVLYAGRTRALVPESDWVRLVRAVGARDESALHELYERTHRIVFTLTVRITHDRQAAEELTLDVFHDVWRRAATYDPAGGTVVGWIMNQARSRAIDRLRFNQRKKRVNPCAGNGTATAVAADPLDALDVEQQSAVMRDALSVLTPDERAAIETAFFGEMTYAETAARLNQPVGTVKTRIRSALTKLRDALGVRRTDE